MANTLLAAWPANEIVFTAIVGFVMLAAFLEWFLWVAAFMYCLWKVFQKAEHWTVKLLAIFVGTAFFLLRCIFLPIMVVTLPLPSQIAKWWPPAMVDFLQWFAFWTFAGLLTIPWLFCVFQIVTHHLGRTKRINIEMVLDEISAPKVVVVMPCYKEEPDVLVKAINSVVDCDYPASCVHVFLSFDGDQEDELYLNTIEKLGVPLTLDAYPLSIDVAYRASRVTVSRFPHGGKRNCQKQTFQLIDKVYHEYLMQNDDLFILFIDSDCILDRVCLQNFIYDMELSPGNRRDMLAMTGVITSTTRKHSLITLLQDMEYVHGQLFERTVESGCGAVTCLPGALTMLRLSAFRRMAKYYFADKAEQCEDLFDFAKGHLGEDRWLTHLFMIGAKKRYQIQMCTSAFCKTEAVQTMKSLIKQRRRWFLGFITNEVCMLTDWRLWKRYPVLIMVRFMQNTIRTTALLFFIMLLALMTTTKKVKDLPVGFILISLGLNWAMMVYFGFKLKRFKLCFYPVMFIANPFFNWYYMVYGIFTAGQRTWGGPRADAAAADSNTTAQQAIELAEETGDDLNIVPESFIPAAQERKKELEKKGTRGRGGLTRHKSVLQPPDRVIGKFATPERTASGWFQHSDDSGGSVGGPTGGGGGGGGRGSPHVAGKLPLFMQRPRDSFDSTYSAGNVSVYMPRGVVESIMGDEDRRKLELAQASQTSLVAGNAQFHRSPPGQVLEFSDAEPQRGGSADGADAISMTGSGAEWPAHRRLASSDTVSSVASRSHSGHVPAAAAAAFTAEPSSSGMALQPLTGAAGTRPQMGRSPLSQTSFIRTSTTDEVDEQMYDEPASPYQDCCPTIAGRGGRTLNMRGSSPSGRGGPSLQPRSNNTSNTSNTNDQDQGRGMTQ